jgi:hypothetical protein
MGTVPAFVLLPAVALTAFQIVLPSLARSWFGAVDCLADLGRPEQIPEGPVIEGSVEPAQEPAQLPAVLVLQHGYQPP